MVTAGIGFLIPQSNGQLHIFGTQIKRNLDINEQIAQGDFRYLVLLCIDKKGLFVFIPPDNI